MRDNTSISRYGIRPPALQASSSALISASRLRASSTALIMNPSGFALMVVDADSAEMRRVDGHDTGMIFVTSRAPEEMIQGVPAELDKMAQKTKPASKDSAH